MKFFNLFKNNKKKIEKLELPKYREDVHKILIVEDIESNQYVLSRFINIINNNIEIEQAFDGKQALNMILKYKYRLILLDINMPIMNGIELLEKLNSYQLINENIVMCTAYNIHTEKIDEIYNIKENLRKPYTIKQIKNIIDRFYYV